MSTNSLKHNPAIFRASTHRTKFVQRPTQCHRALTRDCAVGWTKTCDAAVSRRSDNRARRFRTDCEGYKPGSRRRTRTGRRAAAPVVFVPGRLARARQRCLRFVVAHAARKLYHCEFRNENRARFAQFSDDCRVLVKLLVLVRRCAPGGLCISSRKQIFRAVWNTVKWSAIAPAPYLAFSLARFPKRRVAHDGCHSAQTLADCLKTLKITFSQLNGRESPRANLCCKVRDRREENVV